MRWKTRILIGLAALVGAAICLSAYLALQVGPELLGARRVLSGPVDDLSGDELVRARDHLIAARESLGSGTADLLRLVPLARQNVDALARVTDALVEVVDAGSVLKNASDRLDSTPLLVDGIVELEMLERVQEPFGRQAGALTDLELALRESRDGWLLPRCGDFSTRRWTGWHLSQPEPVVLVKR